MPMRFKRLYSYLLAGFLGLVGCTQPGDPIYEEYEVAEVGDFVDFATNVLPIFANNCSPCHLAGGASGGVSLDDYDKVEAAGVTVACDPDNSVLYQVLQETPPTGMLKMPLGGALGAEETETIRLWISQGAAGEAPESDLCAGGGEGVGGADAVSSDSSP